MEFLAITVLILLAAISPGPDFAMVVKNALSHSRKSGIYTSVGITLSLLFHASYCIMGLALVIAHSLLLFSIIKYIGAAYLIYIGVQSLLAKKEDIKNISSIKAAKKPLTDLKSLQQGFLCNALNPKAIMFFVALFTMVIKPTTPFTTQIFYAIEIALIHLIWFSGLSIVLTHHKVSKSLKKVQFIVTKIMGGFLILFGLRIATLHQTA